MRGKRRYPVRYYRKTLTRILCGIFLCFGGEDRDEEVPCGSRVGFADIRRGSHACVGNGVILSVFKREHFRNVSAPHFMRDFMRFGGEDRDEGVPCGSRVGGKPTYAEGAGENKKRGLGR